MQLMKQSIYLMRDKVAQAYVRSFDASNDNVAVRYVVDVYGKQPHYTDLELWRSGVAYDVETGEISNTDKAVIALPSAPVPPSIDSMASKAE